MSPPLPSNEEILVFCRTNYHQGARTAVYPSQDAPVAFIKIASSQSGVESEISHQKFAFDALEALPEQERAVEYASTDALQSHIQALANMPETNGLNINFQNEDLCFCYSDLFEGNFIFTDKGDLYIVDFEHASILPASFMTYALDQPRPICTAIKKDFDLLPSQNLDAMKVAGHNFMIRWRKAGLPLDTTTLNVIPHLSEPGFPLS